MTPAGGVSSRGRRDWPLENGMSTAAANCPEMAMKVPVGGHENCPLMVMGIARHDVVCLAALRG